MILIKNGYEKNLSFPVISESNRINERAPLLSFAILSFNKGMHVFKTRTHSPEKQKQKEFASSFLCGEQVVLDQTVPQRLFPPVS